MLLSPESLGSNSFVGEVAAVYQSKNSPEEIAERLQVAAAQQRIIEVLSNPRLKRDLKPRELHTIVGHHLNRDRVARKDWEGVARRALIYLLDPEGLNGGKIELTRDFSSVRLASSKPQR